MDKSDKKTIVEQGTSAQQRVVTGSLAELASRVKAAGVESPALLIVGEVTRLHETLHWFNAAGSSSNELFNLLNASHLTDVGRLSA